MRIRIVGRGRAGGAFAAALRGRGAHVDLVGGRDRGGSDDPSGDDVDLELLCVPDDAIATVAAHRPQGAAVVAHCSGSRGLDVLLPHDRRASIHPLMSLPTPDLGARRLVDDCTFAVAGDPIVRDVVELLGGRAIVVADDVRPMYHAAACVAANHLVVLAAQVERLAGSAGVPVDAYWTMMRHTLDHVEHQGATASLTGPAARGDTATIAAHLAALPDGERDLYLALADAAGRLAAGSGPGPR